MNLTTFVLNAIVESRRLVALSKKPSFEVMGPHSTSSLDVMKKIITVGPTAPPNVVLTEEEIWINSNTSTANRNNAGTWEPIESYDKIFNP